MLIKTNESGFFHPLASEMTSQRVYQERRQLIRLMAGVLQEPPWGRWQCGKLMRKVPVN